MPREASNVPKQSLCPGAAALAQGRFINNQTPKPGGQAFTQGSNPDDKCSITQVTPFQECYAVLLSEIKQFKIPLGSDNTCHTSDTLNTQTVTRLITERKELSYLVESSLFCFILF